MKSPKATKDNQQNDEKMRQKDNQRSGSELSETSPLFSLLIVVGEDNFVYTQNLFFVNHQFSSLKFSELNLGEEVESG